MNQLDIIRRPIEEEMSIYREYFDSFLRHDNSLLNEVLSVVASRKGKMMRPILTLLVSKLLGRVGEAQLSTAATFEFLHTASLVHDDIVDESDERRGQASVNNAYGNKIAVLVGDYILALSLENAAKTANPRLVEIVSKASQELSNGELLQLKNVHNQAISEEVYFRIIKAKTAALFSACTEAAAMSVNADENDVQRMKSFGEIVGICFQIRDDIFDYNTDAQIGKPTGNDMKEGKLTLPVIHALFKVNDPDMFALATAVKNGVASEQQIADLVAFTKANGGIEYANQVMLDYADKAKNLLNVFDDSDVKQALCDYVDFVVGRSL